MRPSKPSCHSVPANPLSCESQISSCARESDSPPVSSIYKPPVSAYPLRSPAQGPPSAPIGENESRAHGPLPSPNTAQSRRDQTRAPFLSTKARQAHLTGNQKEAAIASIVTRSLSHRIPLSCTSRRADCLTSANVRQISPACRSTTVHTDNPRWPPPVRALQSRSRTHPITLIDRLHRTPSNTRHRGATCTELANLQVTDLSWEGAGALPSLQASNLAPSPQPRRRSYASSTDLFEAVAGSATGDEPRGSNVTSTGRLSAALDPGHRTATDTTSSSKRRPR